MKIKYLILVVLLRKQIIIQKSLRLKKNLTDHDHDKYIKTPKFNILAADVFNEKLNFDNTVSSLNNKIAANKTRNESIENELKKLKTFDSSYFIGKSHFEEDGTQKYLVF